MARWSHASFSEGDYPDSYARFLSLFGHCFVVEDGKGRRRAHYELLSEYMPEPLEAFAVVIYMNNYNKFMKMHWRDADTLSSVSNTTGGGASGGALFTQDGKGGAKYGGWSEEGMVFYNRVHDTIEYQRKRAERKSFEAKVRKLIQEKGKKGAKRKVSTIPVRNGISKLRRLVTR
jgi:hypothetical protein